MYQYTARTLIAASKTPYRTSRTPSRRAILQYTPSVRWYSDKGKAKAVDEAAHDHSESGSSSSSDPAGEESKSKANEDGDDGKLVKELRSQLGTKEAEIVDLTGRLRYSHADYLNLQRISRKEKEQAHDFAISRFASDLLDTVDVLSLALRSVPSSIVEPTSDSNQSTPDTPSKDSQPGRALRELYTGVSLTNKQLLSTLAKHGVTQFDPTGERFDPNLHEALYAAPIPDKEPGTVVETQKVGYMLKGRVLRAAKVGIVQEGEAR